MELHGINVNPRRWVMLMVSIGCFIVFCVPIVGQPVGDPAKKRMQETMRMSGTVLLERI